MPILEANQLREILLHLLPSELGQYAYHVPGEDVSLVSGVETGDGQVVLSSLADGPLQVDSYCYFVFPSQEPFYASVLKCAETSKTISKDTPVAIESSSYSIPQQKRGEMERRRFPAIHTHPPKLSNYFRIVPESGIEIIIERSPSVQIENYVNWGLRQQKNYTLIIDQYNRNGDLDRTSELIAREFAHQDLDIRLRPQQETEQGLTYARLTVRIPSISYVRHIPYPG